MRLIVVFSVFLFGFLTAVIITNERIHQFIFDNFVWIGLGTCALILMTLLLYVVIKWKITRWAKNKLKVEYINDPDQLIPALVDSVTNREALLTGNYDDKIKSTVISILLWYGRHITLQRTLQTILLIFTGFFTVLASYLLYEQNEKIELQTQANIVSSILTEGARRAALFSEGERLFNEIRSEVLKISQTNNGAPKLCSKTMNQMCVYKPEIGKISRKIYYILSHDLRSRLSAYSHNQRPYYLATSKVGTALDLNKKLGEQFEFPYISPERGKLLEELALNRIATPHLRDFNFRYSFSSKAQLNDAYLKNAELSGANLSGARLEYADLENARLNNADLGNASLSGANLKNASLKGANMKNASLISVNLEQANLLDADLRGSYFLGDADLRSANLSGVDLRDTNLHGVDLRGADLRGADLRRIDLSSENFGIFALDGADLRGADLRDADLEGADLEDVDLRGDRN